MADRSASITVQNWTGKTWRKTNTSLPHGEWSHGGDLTPPDEIPPVSLDGDGDPRPGMVYFEAESQGFATGVEGTVNYTSPFGDISIYFDNPWWGTDSFSVTGPDSLSLTWDTFTGNNASTTVVIRKR
jgi:hypothetical protein